MSKYHSDKVFVVNLDAETEQRFSTKSAALDYCKSGGIDPNVTVFDSKKEYRRWGILRAMQRRGEITGLERQVPFVLVPAQYEDIIVQLKTKRVAKRRRVEAPVIYKADFQYRLSTGELVTEDVKSKATRKLPEYVIKRKLMLYIHGIRLKEII